MLKKLLGLLAVIGGLFAAASANKKKEVKELDKAIKVKDDEVKELEKEVKVLKQRRKLTKKK